MGKRKDPVWQDGGGVVSEYNVEGYLAGMYLPHDCGDIVNLKVTVLSSVDESQTLDLAMDRDTALGLSKALAAVAFSLDTHGGN